MKIAIIGTGIAGLTAARALHRSGHQVSVYEQAARLGGHTATIDVREGDKHLAIDTGFIVFNDWTYPNFIALMDELGVNSRPTPMSFSVSDRRTGLEYAGSNLNSLFAQRRNLFSPRYLGMLRDIMRFNKEVEQDIQQLPNLAQASLAEYLQFKGYGAAFREHYLLPMGAAIWSARQENMLKVPLGFFVGFFRNHGLLSITNRPQWRVIEGGSKAYIAPLIAEFREQIRLNTQVTQVRRLRNTQESPHTQVEVITALGSEVFDQVVFACHSDQALRILGEQASALETKLLRAIPYEANEVVLHTDTRLLPANRRCWSSWNVLLGQAEDSRPRLTYNMNILQGVPSDTTYCVSLNQSAAIDPSKVLGVYHYEHPIFDAAGLDTQARWEQINGVDGLWYCGAWWRNGFHEDGVWSALRVASAIGKSTAAAGATHAA